MTTTVPQPPRTWRTVVTRRAFVVHYLQMVAAMGIGMAAAMPVTMLDGDDARVELLRRSEEYLGHRSRTHPMKET